MENEKNELPKLSVIDGISFSKTCTTWYEFRKKLKEYDVDFDMSNADGGGETILISLTKEQSISSENVWVCCEYFADTNIKDTIGNTALHYACKNNNKSVILALLLFNADSNISNDEDKKPFDYSNLRDDEIESIIKAVNRYKIQFLQLTRKRRYNLRKIFEDMDIDQTKTINEMKMKSFYEWLNDDDGLAAQDAKWFIEETKLFKGDEITFEEFIIGMSRIVYNYGNGIVDALIQRYKELCITKKKNNDIF